VQLKVQLLEPPLQVERAVLAPLEMMLQLQEPLQEPQLQELPVLPRQKNYKPWRQWLIP